MRILIADDDRIALRILAAALRQWEFDVIEAPDGQAAWTRIAADHPAIAILDWMMPELDGPDLCRRIRLDPALAATYVILLTSRDCSVDRVSGLDAGADDYLIKPFDREELRARVHVGVRVATLQGQLARQVADLQDALSRVRALEGFISICSYCKRIRSDENWEQLESYISQHSNTRFSHGVCPSCLEAVLKESQV